MQYDVFLTKEAEGSFYKLDITSQDKLFRDYELIKTTDITAVNVKSLGNKLFEIKTDNLRSVFEYRKGQIIVIAIIFVKKTQKTPKNHLKLARNILDKFDQEPEK